MATENVFILGQESGIIRLNTLESIQQADLALASQVRRQLLLLSHDLDLARFGASSWLEALKPFWHERDAMLRILVAHPETALALSHPLLALARRLTSYIQIKKIDPALYPAEESWLIADGLALVREQKPGMAYADMRSLSTAPELTERFNAWFTHASDIAELRSLML
ncbi:MAG: hypothetical protein HKM02_04055 [Pseudomonadales bacterium]|nr:hypothetical protein [Pseudomonadales bacterium]